MREIEWLMATYHLSLEVAVWQFPRVIIHLLIPAYAERNGQSAGMTRPDRASIAARSEMRDMLASQYEITDAPLNQIGWQIGDPPEFIKKRFL